jgi:AcrR family transcriptional regulator
MEAVAAAARVGKGTVFRRFGDRTGLLMALLDHTEKRFQAAFLSGPPPLGPGAPPVERLRAFGRALLRRSAGELDLMLAAEPDADRRFTAAPRRVLCHHVAVLLRQAVPDADCELLAHSMMGQLDPVLVHHLTRQCGMPLERLEAAWVDLVDRVTGTGRAG